jgi:hypothetical protein
MTLVGVGAKAKTLPFTPAFVFLAAPTEAEEPARSTLRLLHYETRPTTTSPRPTSSLGLEAHVGFGPL